MMLVRPLVYAALTDIQVEQSFSDYMNIHQGVWSSQVSRESLSELTGFDDSLIVDNPNMP